MGFGKLTYEELKIEYVKAISSNIACKRSNIKLIAKKRPEFKEKDFSF